MKRTKRWGVSALLALALLLALAQACLAAEDTIRVSSRSDPQSVISEQDVTVTIKVYNTGSEDVTGEITLFDSDGQSVEEYNGLKAGQTVTYSGTWRVTAEQISQKKISFYIRYPSETEGEKPAVRAIPITIQTEAPAPQLTASYTVSPAAARTGQQVTTSYRLVNTGNIELRNIEIVNPDFSEKKLTAASLSVGESVTLTDAVMMGEKELVSDPKITYRSADADKTLTVDDLGKRTITVAQNGLVAELSSKNAANVYPGEAVDLAITLKNTGETAISNIGVSVTDGKQLLTVASLAPGATYEGEAPYVPTGEETITLTVTGTMATGEDVTVVSGALPITMQDVSTALLLKVHAEAQTTVMHSEPETVRFGIVVENTGDTDAATLTISEAGTVVETIPSLPSGEKKTVVIETNLSMAGKVLFAVSGKDALGNERTYYSEEIAMTYVAPTPAPTRAPTPTPVPPTPSPAPTATPEPTLREKIESVVDPMVLAVAGGILVALIVLIAALRAVRSGKRKKRLAAAVDTLAVSPTMRDSYGRRRRGSGAKKAKNADGMEQIVTTTELTESEAAARAEEQKTAPEHRKRRGLAEEEVPQGKTLRVEPLERRPEYDQDRTPSDARTRVFNRVTDEEEAPAAEATKKVQAVRAEAKAEPTEDKTVRLDRRAVDELRSQAEDEPEEKPAKKRHGLFGWRKSEPEDDLIDDAYPEDEDDDLYE